ncbi:MAG: hypothetical protein GC186_11785 [Rhodobacteraceae bacterium]|nr:hypothetical protein [Paracoccaceae bacterium]
MSDSMTSREIEDVLSSIRRLVSEETRTPPRPEAVSRAPAPFAEKLVLTPDFRVPDPVATPAEDAAEGTWSGSDSRLGARIAVLEAAVAQRPDEWEPDGSEEAPADFVPHFSSAGEAAEAEAHDDHAAEPDPVDDVLPEALAETSDPQDWQPEVAEVAAEQEPQQELEPETMPDAPESPEPLEWQDEPRAAAPQPQATVDVEDALFDDDEGGDDLLDEEVLRDMIREIIRQELQGTLGERITRNVRKLVRAEINRAMAAKAFE